MDGLDIDLTTPPRRQSTRNLTHTVQPQVKSGVSFRKHRCDALDQDDEDKPTAGNSSLTHTAQPQAKSSGSSRKRRHPDAFDHDDEDEPSLKDTYDGFTLSANIKMPYNRLGLDPHCVFKWLSAGTFQSVLSEKVYTLLSANYINLRPWFLARGTIPAWTVFSYINVWVITSTEIIGNVVKHISTFKVSTSHRRPS